MNTILNTVIDKLGLLNITTENKLYYLELLRLPDKYFKPIFVGLIEGHFLIEDLIPSKIQKAIRTRFFNSDLLNQSTESLEDNYIDNIKANLIRKNNNDVISSIITINLEERENLQDYIKNLFELVDVDDAVLPSRIENISLNMDSLQLTDLDIEILVKTRKTLNSILKEKQLSNFSKINKVNQHDWYK